MADQTDIMSAIKQIAAERKIDADEIISAIKESIKFGFRNEYEIEEMDLLEVEMDPVQGHIAVFATKTVVDKVENDAIEINKEDAREINSAAKIGESVKVDITPAGDFGRIAAQTARQVILQKLREAEKDAAIREVKDRMGEIETVRVQKITQDGSVICELNRAKAIMPQDERVPTEFYRLGSSIKVLLKSIEEDDRGKYVLISRSDPDFLEELFRIEVPEIDSGTVEIMAIAREAGIRSKVAVKSNSDGIDPIGSCVGQKGVRINSIMNELKLGRFEEKVDIILWDEDEEEFVANAISPAEAIELEVTDTENKEIKVTVSNDQYSLAIGRDGLNASLAAALTGWKIDIIPEDPVALEKAEEERKAQEEGRNKEGSTSDDDSEIEETEDVEE